MKCMFISKVKIKSLSENSTCDYYIITNYIIIAAIHIFHVFIYSACSY